MAEHLRLSAELVVPVLREVVHGSIVFMKGAEVLVIIRVVVIIESVHAFVRFVERPIPNRLRVEAALLEDLADLSGI